MHESMNGWMDGWVRGTVQWTFGGERVFLTESFCLGQINSVWREKWPCSIHTVLGCCLHGRSAWSEGTGAEQQWSRFEPDISEQWKSDSSANQNCVCPRKHCKSHSSPASSSADEATAGSGGGGGNCDCLPDSGEHLFPVSHSSSPVEGGSAFYELGARMQISVHSKLMESR